MRHKAYILFMTALVFSASCSKESLKTEWASQEDRIDSYINSLPTEPDPENPDSPYVQDVIYNNGASRVIIRDGNGERLAENGTVSFYYAGYVFKGNVSAQNLFATNVQSLAIEAGWSLTEHDFSVKTVKLDKDNGLVEGLRNGLTGTRAGEICYILFSGEHGFGKRPVGIIPGNSALFYQIQVVSVEN